ncbi:hypothetical protein B566_EDAN017230 [Ephemera danica]|nr:hypothetical protein B566_EDAN017230 [Ephemera danica]
MLHCCLHRAKGLRSMDINGLCDPYCRAQLLPVAGGKACAPLRTKTVHKTREPEFNETLAWCRVTETDHARKTLHLVLFDDDKYGHEALGAARLHLSRLSPGHPSHFNEEVGEEESPGRGRILVSLCYATRRRALLVGVQLRHDPQRRKFKTAIKWRNLNPEFNEEFALDVKLGELSRRALLVTVWDKDLGKANDYLGGLELGFCSKGDRLKHWLDALKFPDRRHERWHSLTAHHVVE